MLLIAGMDARYHLPVLRHSVFANRLYLNASFGKQRLLNHLGGTENWLIPKYSTESVSITDQDFAFSQQVTEVRGHPLGARKGSSAAVLSTEIRIPFSIYSQSKLEKQLSEKSSINRLHRYRIQLERPDPKYKGSRRI